MDIHMLPAATDSAGDGAPQGDARIFLNIGNELLYDKGVSEVKEVLREA